MNSRSLSVLLSPYLAATGATSVSEIKMSEKTRTMLPQSTGVMVVTFTTWLSFSTTVLSSEGGSCVALPNVELTKFWIRSTTSAALSEEQQRANLKFPVSPRRVLFGKTKTTDMWLRLLPLVTVIFSSSEMDSTGLQFVMIGLAQLVMSFSRCNSLNTIRWQTNDLEALYSTFPTDVTSLFGWQKPEQF